MGLIQSKAKTQIININDYTFDDEVVNTWEIARPPQDTAYKLPGITNKGGNDCWAISLMQTIASIPSHRIATLAICDTLQGSENDNWREAGRNLKETLNTLIENRRQHRHLSTVDSRQIRRAFTLLGIVEQGNGQEDPYESFSRLLNYGDGRAFTGRMVRKKHLEALNIFYPLPAKLQSASNEQILAAYTPLNNESPILEQEENERFLHMRLTPYEEALKQLSIQPLAPQERAHQEDELFKTMMRELFDVEGDETQTIDLYSREQGALQRCVTKKETLTWQAPPNEFLFVMARFSQDGRRKINVDTPVQLRFTLDADIIGRERTSFGIDSFIIHHGTSRDGGHYTSCQKIDGRWYHFNDENSEILTDNQAKHLARQGYLFHVSREDNVADKPCLISLQDVQRFIPNAGQQRLKVEISFVKDQQKLASEGIELLERCLPQLQKGQIPKELPENKRTAIEEALWLQEGMQDIWEYGKHKFAKDPAAAIRAAPYILYHRGSSLAEQLIEKEKDAIALFEERVLDKELEKAKTQPNADKALIPLLQTSPLSCRERLLDSLVIHYGVDHGKKTLEREYNFGRDAIDRDISNLFAISTMKKAIKKLQLTEKTLQWLHPSNDPRVQALISCIEEQKDKDKLLAHYIALSEDNKNLLRELVYWAEVAKLAIEHAEHLCQSSSYEIIITAWALKEPLPSWRKDMAAAIEKEQNLTAQQKEHILRRFL